MKTSKKVKKANLIKNSLFYLVMATNMSFFTSAKNNLDDLEHFTPVVEINRTFESNKEKTLDELFLSLSNNSIQNYALDTNNELVKQNLNLFISKKMPVFENLVDKAYSETGIPKHHNWGTMLNESGGNSKAVSYAGARGLMQIMPSTYSERRDRINFDIRKIKEVIPDSSLELILNKGFEQYFSEDMRKWDFKNLILQTTVAKEGTQEYRIKELEWYVQRLPIALLSLKQYGDKFPGTGRSIAAVLDDSEMSIRINNIIKWDDLLRGLSHDYFLQEETFGKYSSMKSNIPPEAIPYSYIAGPGRTLDLLKKGYALYGKNVSAEKLSDYFSKNMLRDTKPYVENVLGSFNYFKNIDIEYRKNNLGHNGNMGSNNIYAEK